MIPNAKIGSHHGQPQCKKMATMSRKDQKVNNYPLISEKPSSSRMESGFFPHQRNKKLKYSKSNKIMIESTETEPKIVPEAQNNRLLNHSHSVDPQQTQQHSHSVGSSLNLHNNTISSKIKNIFGKYNQYPPGVINPASDFYI